MFCVLFYFEVKLTKYILFYVTKSIPILCYGKTYSSANQSAQTYSSANQSAQTYSSASLKLMKLDMLYNYSRAEIDTEIIQIDLK
jgi:hypothetical protein